MTIKSLDIAQEQINSIIALFSSGKTQEALDAVETLIKSYPNDPVLYNISGACYAGLGQFDAAVKNSIYTGIFNLVNPYVLSIIALLYRIIL